jgi:tetratricopeptide (TPR) repeat protein
MSSSNSFLFFFIIMPLFIFSQEITPFVTYDFDKDSIYRIKMLDLKKLEKKDPSIKTFISIADLSYYYKDWEIAISFYEKIIVENPSAENYFKLAVAAARKSLEVSRFFSITYVLKAKKSVLKAHRLAPKNPRYLKLLIKLFAEIPDILGGNKEFAQKKAEELFIIDPIKGLMIKGYLNDIDKYSSAAKSKYEMAFYLLEKNYESFDTFFEENDRDLIFEIGNVVVNHEISPDLGISALKFYANSYDFMDNYPLATVYYLLSRIYFFKQDFNICSDYLARALKINPKFQTALVFKKKYKL